MGLNSIKKEKAEEEDNERKNVNEKGCMAGEKFEDVGHTSKKRESLRRKTIHLNLC